MESLLKFAQAFIGFLLVLLAWFGVQAFIRRGSGCASNKDVLDFMKHGCAGCKGDGACHNRRKEEQHELT
jgi:hypothetical protein